MRINCFEEINDMALDTLREVGSIGAGNAATALSSLLGSRVDMSLPSVRVMEFNEAVEQIGGFEAIVSGVLVKLGGEINGIMLCIQQVDFVNVITSSMLNRSVEDFDDLDEMGTSALIEVGNIMISSYMRAIADLSGIRLTMSVPSQSVNMLGGILTVPMAAFGNQSNHVLMVGGQFKCDDKEVHNDLLLFPDINSLNYILHKLGVL
ncbi:MAG: chemotaxis protein CheC [Butyricicoccus sp.]|nr:chemotaxis protein CheC [Butyricicoccus pullicaecorum]